MKIESFFTERYYALYEFSAPYLLSASDCESLTVDEMLAIAGASRDVLGQLHLGYTETQGAPMLRREIAGLYDAVDAEQVIGLSAPEEGIFVTMHALLEAGDEVIVLAPCYDSLANVAEYLGCRVTRWSFKEQESEGGWQLDLAELERLITPHTRLVIANFPHNPTGYLPSLEEWQALIRIVDKAGVWLFSDEMYRGLEHNPAARLPAGCDSYERAITLGGLSKTHGLPGLRAGWLALQDRTLGKSILGWKDYTTICASAPSEALARIALQAGDKLVDRSRRTILENLALAEPFFDQWRDVFRWHRPMAGSVALVGLQDGSAEAFCHRLVAEQGVLLLPSTGMGFGDGHVRFGFGRQSFPEALAQLDDYVRRQSAASQDAASR